MSEQKVYKIDNHKFARNHPEAWKFIKFILVSVLGAGPQTAAQLGFSYMFRALGADTLPNFFLFNIMSRSATEDSLFLTSHVVYASICALIVGQVIAFVLNRTISFHADGNAAVSGFYNLLLVIFTIIVGGGFVTPQILLLGQRLNVSLLNSFFNENLLIAILIQLAMAVPTIWIYPANRFIIHRQKKQKKESTPDEQCAT